METGAHTGMGAAERHEEEIAPTPSRPRGPSEHAHPSPRQYVMVAIALAVVTMLEVGMFYLQQGFPAFPVWALVVSLLIMAVVKFSLVAMWFMHLRFDSPVFRRFFVTGIALALSVYTIALLTVIL